MRARPPILLIATAAMLTVSVVGYQAKVYGAPTTASQTSHISRDASLAPAMMPPVWSRGARGAALDGLPARITQATNNAAADGATIAVAVLDRASNQLLSNGNDQLIAIASVAKLFIADDALSQGAPGAEGNRQLSSSDRQALDIMLRSSDDDAAETFWNERGGETIIADVTRRYGLTSTAPPSDGRWWNTTSSASDLVRYYNMLLNGSGASLGSGPRSSSTTSRRPLLPASMATRSGSASRTGCTPNRLPSNRAGCAASAAIGCTCRPA